MIARCRSAKWSIKPSKSGWIGSAEHLAACLSRRSESGTRGPTVSPFSLKRLEYFNLKSDLLAAQHSFALQTCGQDRRGATVFFALFFGIPKKGWMAGKVWGCGGKKRRKEGCQVEAGTKSGFWAMRRRRHRSLRMTATRATFLDLPALTRRSLKAESILLCLLAVRAAK